MAKRKPTAKQLRKRAYKKTRFIIWMNIGETHFRSGPLPIKQFLSTMKKLKHMGATSVGFNLSNYEL